MSIQMPGGVPGFENGDQMHDSLLEMGLLRDTVIDGTEVAGITQRGMLTFFALSLFAKPKLLFECLEHAKDDNDRDGLIPGKHTNPSAEACRLCKRYAPHKVEQDRTSTPGHPLTAYLCCICFSAIMGPAADCGVD